MIGRSEGLGGPDAPETLASDDRGRTHPSADPAPHRTGPTPAAIEARDGSGGDDDPGSIAATGLLSIGEARPASIDFAGDADWFPVQLAALEWYALTITPGYVFETDESLRPQLFDAQGRQLTTTFGSTFDGTNLAYPEYTGLHYVGVTKVLTILPQPYTVTVTLTDNPAGDGPADGTFAGTPGRDVVHALDGDDRLVGSPGGDLMDGGSGTDTVTFATADRAVVLDLALPRLSSGDAAGDLYTSIERFVGTAGADRMRGGDAGDAFQGGGGSDRLYGRRGDDTLQGGDGADALYGNGGGDRLIGGGDLDRRDRFIFFDRADSRSDDPDSILDFVAGTDRIELGRIDADTGAAGNQAFAFVGADPFGGIAGELRAERVTDRRTNVEADVDGDGAADFVVFVFSGGQLTADDFLL